MPFYIFSVVKHPSPRISEAKIPTCPPKTQVETSLLLHDALYPDQPVREDAARSETKRQWQMPRASQPFLQAMQEQALAKEAAAAEKVADAMAAAKLGQDPNSPAFTVKPTSGASAAAPPGQAAAGGNPSADSAADASWSAGAPSQASPPPLTQVAGERAARLLPCCYLLLESVIEVLAEDFAMQEDEMMVIDEGDEIEEEEEAPGGSPQGPGRSAGGNGLAGRQLGASSEGIGGFPQRQGQQLLQPGVSQKAAQQLMYSLESTVAVVLQFMVCGMLCFVVPWTNGY